MIKDDAWPDADDQVDNVTATFYTLQRKWVEGYFQYFLNLMFSMYHHSTDLSDIFTDRYVITTHPEICLTPIYSGVQN